MIMDRISNTDTECRLQIGDVCCSLRFKDPAYSSKLREYYRGFISEEEAELTIDVNVVSLQESIAIPFSIFMHKTVNGNSFVFYDGLITGTLNLEENQCTINVKSILLAEKGIFLFEQLLFQIYYTLLKQSPNKSANNFLLHSCAVSRDGFGYVFT